MRKVDFELKSREKFSHSLFRAKQEDEFAKKIYETACSLRDDYVVCLERKNDEMRKKWQKEVQKWQESSPKSKNKKKPPILPKPEAVPPFCDLLKIAYLKFFRNEEQSSYLEFENSLNIKKLEEVSHRMIRDAHDSSIVQHRRELSLAGEALRIAVNLTRNMLHENYDNDLKKQKRVDGRGSSQAYVQCYYCWRLVSAKNQTLKRPARCDLHKSSTSGARKIRKWLDKRGKELERKNGSLVHLRHLLSYPPEVVDILREVRSKTREVFVSDPSNVWLGEGHRHFPPHGFKVKPKSHDMQKDWMSYPKTRSYVVSKNGGDSSVLNDTLACLYTLQDHLDDNIEDNNNIKTFLDDCASQDFGLARFFILTAEVWLQFYSAYESTHGGERDGAGRPSKVS